MATNGIAVCLISNMTPSAPAVTSLVRYTTCGGMDYPPASEGRSGRRPSGMSSISHQVRLFGLVFAVYNAFQATQEVRHVMCRARVFIVLRYKRPVFSLQTRKGEPH